MRADLSEGIEGSGVKPGILKCAIDAAGLTEHVERVVRSVCRIHKETGTPLCIHTHPETRRGLDALRRAGWRGHGPVPWAHEPNRGFLRALAVLQQAAERIGETEEAVRCTTFLTDCDPVAARELLPS